MKISISIIFFVFINIVFAIEKEQAVKECVGELSVDEGIDSYFNKNGEIPDETDKNAKCVFHCVSKKLKLENQEGEIDKDKMVRLVSKIHPDIDKTKIEAVVLLCSEKQKEEDDPCEKWYEFTKCQLKAYMKYEKNSAD